MPYSSSDFVGPKQDARSAPLMIAASELSERLSDNERAALRARGELPAWFLPDVVRRAREVKREMRH